VVAHKEAPDVEVFVDGSLDNSVRCLDVVLGSGAAGLSRATLEVQKAGQYSGRYELKDGDFANLKQPEVEVVIAGKVCHWGIATCEAATMDGDNGDRLTAISRMEAHHFGGPLNATVFWNPLLGLPSKLTLPTVFNPQYDGQSIGNMHSNFTGLHRANLFFDVDASRSVASRAFNRGFPVSWTLPRAVYYLCTFLNPSESYVANPTLQELNAVLPSSIATLRDHEAPYGEYLPEQLDRILAPYGFGWTVDFIARGRRKIRVFARGAGPQRDLKMQAAGTEVDVAETNLEALALTSDVSSKAFNVVHLLGDHGVYEATFTLVPGWPKNHDDYPNTNPDQLTKNHASWGTTPILADVWRKWVLNEAGYYIGYRPEIRQPYNLAEIFDDLYVPRRRKFVPCLTLKDDGTPQGTTGGVLAEYKEQFNLASEEATGVWIPLHALSGACRQFSVLENECGIRFDGDDIPYEIFSQGQYASIRVTARIESDQRLFVIRQPQIKLLKARKIAVFDLGNRYKFRHRHPSSRFVGTPFKVSEQNDASFMAELGDDLLKAWNQASINGTVTLTGIDYDYSRVIGATISGINGRKVEFNVGTSVARYPSVTSARINVQNQSLDLTLDTSNAALAL